MVLSQIKGILVLDLALDGKNPRYQGQINDRYEERPVSYNVSLVPFFLLGYLLGVLVGRQNAKI